MRTNINRFKQRTDYTRSVSPRQPSARASTLDSVDVPVAKQSTRLRPRGELRKPAPVIAPAPSAPAAPRAEFPEPAKISYPRPEKVETKAANTPVNTDSSALSMRFSLPTFRQPPTTEQAPSAQSWRLAFIVLIGLAFFTFGYHNLWHMLH